MRTDTNLQFIREKVYQVRSAIMYSLSNELIKFPNCIITAVKIDDEGLLWFYCDKPPYLPEQLPSAFPARLHFYRKGKLFHIEISGSACIANSIPQQSEEYRNRLLIKMEMKNITYKDTETKKRNQATWLLDKAYHWILRHTGTSHTRKPFFPPFSHSQTQS